MGFACERSRLGASKEKIFHDKISVDLPPCAVGQNTV